MYTRPSRHVQARIRPRALTRRSLLAGLAAAVLVLALHLALATPALAFNDTAGSPYLTAIADLSSRGIVSGFDDGSFRPDAGVKRMQFAKMIVRTMDLPVSESDVCPFPDVDPSTPPELYPDHYVAVAAAQHITQGYDNGTFGPQNLINRAQVITMVVRAVDQLHAGLLHDATGPSTWGDFDATHAANAAKAEANGLLAGLPLASLDAFGPMPRGEVAQVLHNLLGLLDGGDGNPDGLTVSIDPGYTPPALDLPHLGSASFVLDPALPASTAKVEDGKDTTLSLTDGAGLTWTLVLPDGALTAHPTITMRALKNLTSADIPGVLRGGVVLEPEGITFLIPARLTVTGPGMAADKGFIITGDAGGTAMDAVKPDGAAHNSTLLRHFSPWIFVDPADPGAMTTLTAKTRAGMAASLATAKALLAVKELHIPPPPSVELGCSDDVLDMLDSTAVNHWIYQALDPEQSALSDLVSWATLAQLVGLDTPDELDVVGKLALRQGEKAKQLMKTYRGQREKVRPVSLFAIVAGRQMALLGVGSGESIVDRVGSFVAAVVPGMLDDLKSKHDYKFAHPLLVIAKELTLLGMAEGDSGGQAVADQVLAALEFDVQMQFTLNFIDRQWVLRSDFHVKSDSIGSGGVALSGTGVGNYVSYTGPFSMTGNPFTVDAKIKDFNPCDGTATVSIDRFFADSELYNWKPPQSLPLVMASFASLYQEFVVGDRFEFPVSVRNLQADAVDESVVRTLPGTESVLGELEIVLTHAPGSPGS